MKKVEKFLEKYSLEVIVSDFLKDDDALYLSEKFQKEMNKHGIDWIEINIVNYHAKSAIEICEVKFFDEDGKILLTKTV